MGYCAPVKNPCSLLRWWGSFTSFVFTLTTMYRHQKSLLLGTRVTAQVAGDTPLTVICCSAGLFSDLRPEVPSGDWKGGAICRV